MRKLSTLLLLCGMVVPALAQTTITNGGFELWGNTVPAGDTHTEPTNWYSDQSGGGLASLGPQTCFQSTSAHSGTYCVKVETENSLIGGAVNGVVTTAVVNAPTTSKADGYIGTVNSGTSSDDRRMNFTGRPDSLVGWYQYTQGGSAEQGKIRVILHTGDYYDPETPTTYHPDPTANKIADALFLTPTSNVTSWTRFSVPFNYVSASSPAYIMINVTSSANQLTTVNGSILLLDDLDVIYNPAPCDTVTMLAASSITSTTATISWTPSTGAAGSIYAVDNSPTPPATGTFTTATSVPLTGLTPSTLYYAHVYDSCSAGSSSPWVTVPFTTLHPVGVSIIRDADFAISAFPNPAKDILSINISGTLDKTGKVELLDLSGRLISTTIATSNTTDISMSGLTAGIYVIRYIDTKHTQITKIIKQ